MKVINRKARYDYEIFDKIEAGIALKGAEVKSVKEGKIKLNDAYVKVVGNEICLINAHIHPYKFADNRDYKADRQRKLLLHRKEILHLIKKIENRNLALVPLSCYNKGPKIKIEIAIGKGKKKWEKKEKKKRQDIDREIEKTLKDFG